MKKLLLLLFSISISLGSLGETIICSGKVDMGGKIRDVTEAFKRSADKFIVYTDETLEIEMYTLEIAYESDLRLVLQTTMGYGAHAAISIDKRTKEFTSIHLQTPRTSYVSTGICEFYEEYKLLN